MNETIHSASMPSVPWLTSDDRVRASDASMSREAEKAPQAAVDSLNRVVQGAHDAVDRLADNAAPAVRQLGESVSSAEAALRAKADQLGRTRDAWAESLRGTVRGNPLTAVAAAVALGAVIARITR